jgi:hypothetical protein
MIKTVGCTTVFSNLAGKAGRACQSLLKQASRVCQGKLFVITLRHGMAESLLQANEMEIKLTIGKEYKYEQRSFKNKNVKQNFFKRGITTACA